MIPLEDIKSSLLAGADWLANSQNSDTDSADLGRFLYAVNLENGDFYRSTGWQTGFGVYASLSAYNLSKDKKYLQAATNAIKYLKSLQILDPRQPLYFGAMREETPQTEWMHPRDALSVAWAFLGFYAVTRDKDCLERASLYADWMLKYAMSGDWIIATVNLGGKNCPQTDDTIGSFQSGSILFLLELFQATQNPTYLDAAYRMSNYYVDHLINEKGEITVILDPIGNKEKTWEPDWEKMHRVNDDFGGIALVEAYKVFKKTDYKQRCSAYLKWLEDHVNDDGSYLNPVVEVGSATVPIFLASYKQIADADEQERIDKLMTSNLRYLISVQQKTDDPKTNGAFLGMDHRCKVGHGKWVNIRCSSYAIIALSRVAGCSLFPLSDSYLKDSLPYNIENLISGNLS